MDNAAAAPRQSLRKLLDPTSIAVLGASSDPDKAGGRPIRYLRELGFCGSVFPVNPARAEIAGMKSYPSLAAIPGPVDLCIVTVPGDRVEAALRECAEAGIGAVVVFSSGFAEVGREGREKQRRLADIARAHGIALCGPNCLGLINVRSGVGATFTTALLRRMHIAQAPLAFISQSGALAAAILAMMQDNGYGLSYFITTGNEASLGFADYADYLLSETDMRVVTGYLEGVDGARMIPLARKALRLARPLVVMKVGASAAGARASMAHTGNLVGDEAVHDAAFAQLGIVRAHSIDELLDYGHAFTLADPPKGSRVGIVSLSGGGAILMADWCEKVGLEVAPLDATTRARLAEALPWFATAANPLDTTGRPLWDEGLLEKSIDAIASDAGVDMVLVYVGLATGPGERIAAEILSAARAASGKPFLVCWLPEPDPAPQDRLRAAGIPIYSEPVRLVKSAGALAWYRRALDRLETADAARAPAGTPDFSALAAGRTVAEHAAKAFLAQAGIDGTRETLARSADEAAALAAEMGFPVCVKIVSPDIPHRSEIGGVRLGLDSEAAVREAFAAVTAAAYQHRPDATIEGVLVQEMVGGGFELIVSGFVDPALGPAVMCGAGGVLVEVFRDSAIRLAPVSQAEAHDMLAGLRAAPVFEGVRGAPPLDIDAAARAVAAVSRLIAAADGTVETIEINPLAVLPRGRGVRALDALITRNAPDEAAIS